jgi:LPPG:FO 2-phospho-L-lactate transferase
MLRGMIGVADPAAITAVVNTGDDTVLHGLHISPDLDTVTYTLGAAINPATGWGLAGETWQAMEELAALSEGRLSWFNLGDRDLGTHLYRTARLAEGARLSQVTAEIAARWGVAVRLLPMTDDPVETRIRASLENGAERELGFQEYFVGHRHDVPVRAVRFQGVEDAQAGPGVLEAIAGAARIVICPSNPIVSIGPVLATGGIGEAVAARRDDVVAISPIVGGRALKGPADRMLADLGFTSSVSGVARLWSRYAATLVIDPADEGERELVEEAGMACVVHPSVMTRPADAHALARVVLGATVVGKAP